MPSFSQGQVVRVPFPYTDKTTRQRRPALVVSPGPIGEGGRLLWVVMITSAENPPWAGDHDLGEAYAEAGLPIPSLIRPTKIATIEASDADPIGKVSDAVLEAVLDTMTALIGR